MTSSVPANVPIFVPSTLLWTIPSPSVAVAWLWMNVSTGKRGLTRRWVVRTGHAGLGNIPHEPSGGTVHVMFMPSLIPPLSASMNVVPVGIGSTTVIAVGGGGGFDGGQSGVGCRCGAV